MREEKEREPSPRVDVVLEDLDAGGVAVKLGHELRDLSAVLFILSEETVNLQIGRARRGG
jgi:hypothetical protein